MNLRCYSSETTVFLNVFYEMILNSDSGSSLSKNGTNLSAEIVDTQTGESIIFDAKCFSWYDASDNRLIGNGNPVRITRDDIAEDSITVKCIFNHPSSLSVMMGSISINKDYAKGIESTSFVYGISTSNTIEPDSWSPNFPEREFGSVLWIKQVYTYTTGDIEEAEPFPVTGDTGDMPICQFRLSSSNIVPPTDSEIHNVSGFVTLFEGDVLLNAVDGWSTTIPTPTKDYPFIWQRISVDGGNTWGDPYCLSFNTVEYLEIYASPNYYTLNSRGACEKKQDIEVTIDRSSIPYSNGCYMQISRWTEDDAEFDDWIEIDATNKHLITVPIGAKYDKIVVEINCGTISKALAIVANKAVFAGGEKYQSIAYFSNGKIYEDSSLTKEVTHLDRDKLKKIMAGDYCLGYVKDDTGANFVFPLMYNGNDWVKVEASNTVGENYSKIMLDTLPDALTSDCAIPSISAHYAFIGELAANAATIQKIFSQHIRLFSTEDSNGTKHFGSISGGKYNSDGNIDESSEDDFGFYIGCNGEIRSYGITADNATINGSLDHPSITTVEARSDKSYQYTNTKKTHWSTSSLFEKLNTNTYRNVLTNGKIRYKNTLYSKFYVKNWNGTPSVPYSTIYERKNVGTLSGADLLEYGENGETVEHIVSKMGIALQPNEAVFINFHCSGATTTFTCWINNNKAYSEKEDGVGVFRGWLRGSDTVRIRGENSNIFNTRDMSCEVTAYRIGIPVAELASGPIFNKRNMEWTVPKGHWNQARVTFNAEIFADRTRKTAALFVDEEEVESTYGYNTDWYKFEWIVDVKPGQTVKLVTYEINEEDEEAGIVNTYYCNAYAANCAFCFATKDKVILLADDNGNSDTIYMTPEWKNYDISLDSTLGTIENEKLTANELISEISNTFDSGKEFILDPEQSYLQIDDTGKKKIDRIIVYKNSIAVRNSSKISWLTIATQDSNGWYDMLDIKAVSLSDVTSIKTASIIPKEHGKYQIGMPGIRFSSAYIDDITSDGNITTTKNITGNKVYGAVFN